MSTLEIKIDGFPSSEKRTNEQNQELAKKLCAAISAVIGLELSLHDADSYEENGHHKVSVELSPKSYNERVKVKFGSGQNEREFTFTGWDIYGESAFEIISDSGCYSDTGGGWRDTYRRLFAPLAAEYLREPKYVEQRAECPHFSFEPADDVSGIVMTPPRMGMSFMGNAKLANLSMVENCPHTSADSEYIGEGKTQHTCRCCGYYSVTSNPKYHE